MTRPEVKACDHMLEPNALGGRHAFEWSGDGPRNVWNPFHPVCSKCGISIGEIITGRRAPSEADKIVEELVVLAERAWHPKSDIEYLETTEMIEKVVIRARAYLAERRNQNG